MGVEFQEEQFSKPAAYDKAPSGLAGMVIKLGIAKTKQQANLILIVILVVCIVTIVVIN